MRNSLISFLFLAGVAVSASVRDIIPAGEPRLGNAQLSILSVRASPAQPMLRVNLVLRGSLESMNPAYRVQPTQPGPEDQLPVEQDLIVFAYAGSPDTPILVQGPFYRDTPANRKVVRDHAAQPRSEWLALILFVTVILFCGLGLILFRWTAVSSHWGAAALLCSLIVYALYEVHVAGSVRIDVLVLWPIAVLNLFVLAVYLIRSRRSGLT